MNISYKYLTAWLLMAATALVSCSDDNDDGKSASDNGQPTIEEMAEMAAADRQEAASCVIRALAGLDELPDNWETATFTPQEGVVADEAAPDVRYVIADTPEAAMQYFINITPDATREQTADGYSWSMEGVGTMTYHNSASHDCHGVIDVALDNMPSLRQIRLVPESEVPVNAKYDGEPYYGIGSLVKDSNGRFWICVRPSGGPNRKEYAYFVSFDPKSVTTYKVAQNLYTIDSNGKKTRTLASTSGTWLYAKNLVEKRIAVAAALAFTFITMDYDVDDEQGSALGKELAKINAEYKRWGIDLPSCINSCVPYGCYKSTSAKSQRQVKYEQPVLLWTTMSNLGLECDGNPLAIAYVYNRPDAKAHLLTLTDDYDPSYYFSLCNAIKEDVRYDRWDGENVGYSSEFNIMDYALNGNDTRRFGAQYYQLDSEFAKSPVLLMTQKKIVDKGSRYKNFEDVYIVKHNTLEYNDLYKAMWNSLEYVEIVDGRISTYDRSKVKKMRDNPDI